jgi:hypothetical protein
MQFFVLIISIGIIKYVHYDMMRIRKVQLFV